MELRIERDRVEAELRTAEAELAGKAARVEGLRAELRSLQDALELEEASARSQDLTGITKDRAIVAVLRAASEPLRIQQIVDALAGCGRPDETYNGVSVYLDTLLKQDRIERVSRGLYQAAKSPHSE